LEQISVHFPGQFNQYSRQFSFKWSRKRF